MNTGMDAGDRARMWRAIVAVLALATAVLSSAVGAPRAEAFVYWTDSHRPNHIGRANLDGTGIAREFIFIGAGHDPSFFAPTDTLAVDARSIYWSTARH